MPENPEEINCQATFYEPSPEEIGCCAKCDCDISIPDAHDGLCAVCDEVQL